MTPGGPGATACSKVAVHPEERQTASPRSRTMVVFMWQDVHSPRPSCCLPVKWSLNRLVDSGVQ